MIDELRQMLLRAKPVKILLAMVGEEITASKIARSTETTYSHTNTLIKLFVREGICIKTTDGRKKLITLTQKGIELQKEFAEQISPARNPTDFSRGSVKKH